MAITMLPLDATAGSPSFTSQQTRQALSALYGPAPSGRPLGAISGVRSGTPTTTVFLTGAGSMTWNVAAHSGVLDTQTSALAGPYSYATDGTDTGTITAADPTNPRIDIVYVKANDDVLDGSGIVGGQVLYAAGTPAASPSAPATPARSMVLATISVPKVGAGSPAVSWVAPTFGESAWTSYNPSWTAITTNPAIGNGSIVGAYMEVGGKTIVGRITINIGSTTTAGSGSYRFSLPFPAHSVYTIWHPIGTATVRDISPAARKACFVALDSGSSALLYDISNGAIVSESAPISPATGDQILVSFTYERA